MMMNWNLIFGTFIIASPILFAMIAYPDSISWSWNEGRGGYLFALIFVIAELVGLKIIISKKSSFIVLALGVFVTLFVSSSPLLTIVMLGISLLLYVVAVYLTSRHFLQEV